MSETFPISCISCRRKKIKCNKLWPCGQCQRRYVHCEFPSTFRNIKINEDTLKSSKPQGITSKDEMEELRAKNYQLLQEKNQLADQNRKLLNGIEKQGNESLIESNRKFLLNLVGEDYTKIRKGSVPISGETTEIGEKYYGPQSSNFMIDKLGSYKEENNEPNTTHKKKKKISTITQNEDMFKNKVKTYNSNSENSDNLMKKPLPFLLREDPNFATDTESGHKLNKLNIDTIKYLVTLFFEKWSYHKTFIDITEIFAFLDDYNSIKGNEWEHDDDLLLLYMVLIISIHNLMPKEFYYLNFLCGSSMKDFEAVKNKLTYDLIFNNFDNLRHNLIIESISTIQAYILCTTWYFIEQKYEECWSMMFHTCSIAYAIGLHVMSSFRFNDAPNEEEERDVVRYKVWFALKYVSGQICSILGRPNPISIQVNSSVLRSSYDSSVIDLNKRKTHILLKIGSSECLRLSNLMLIENFMMDFTVSNLLDLDRKFDEEIDLLEWFLNEESSGKHNLNNNGLDIDEYTRLPSRIDKRDILNDLIILYINKAKLFEPFITKFEHMQEIEHILQKLTDSILKFLNFVLAFCDLFLDQIQDDPKFEDMISSRLFRHHFPFLNSFIYQGIIVIFTFLHYKFDSFVKNRKQTNNDFLKLLEEYLGRVLVIDRKITITDKLPTKVWSVNTIHLINRILQQVNIIYERQDKSSESETSNFSYGIQSHVHNSEPENENVEGFFGFHMNDPFWLTDPEKLPYYLTSPFGDPAVAHRSPLSTNLGPDKDLSSHQKPLHPQPLHVQPQADLINYNAFFEPTSVSIPVQNPEFAQNVVQRIETPYFFVSTSTEMSSSLSGDTNSTQTISKKNV